MLNPEAPNVLPTEITPDSLDLAMYEDEMQMHLAQSDPELMTPFGAAEMIDMRTDEALGGLACVYGLNSQVDDIPTSFGASTMLEAFTRDQTDSLF